MPVEFTYTGKKVKVMSNLSNLLNPILYTDQISEVTTDHGILLKGRQSSTAIESGNIGETLIYTSGDDTNRSVNTNYDYTISDLPKGKFLALIRMAPYLFENHSNSMSAGLYTPVVYVGSNVGGYQYVILETSLPSWGNSTNSYSAGLSTHFIKQSDTTWTLYIRVNCGVVGTTNNFWFRVGTINLTLIRIG